MIRNFIPVVAALALVLSAGCKKDKKDGKKETGTAAGTAATNSGSGTATPKEPVKDPKLNPAMLNDMKNCPSAVKGAATEVTKDDKVVTVSVTSDDEAAVAEIRKRAAHLATASKADASEIKHTGGGTGGGLGKCPVVLAGASVAATDSDKGSTITLTPDDAAKLVALYTMSAERSASMNKRGGVAHGTGASMRTGMGSGGNNNLKHKGKRSGAHGSGTGGGGSKGTSKNPCGGKAKNPCGGKAKNPCGGHGSGTGGGGSKGSSKNPCGGKAKNPCGAK